MLQAMDANSGKSSGQLGQSHAGATVKQMYAASMADQAVADAANTFVPQQPQASSQYSSVIMKGAAGTFKSPGGVGTTAAKASANTGTHTFGLGQLNYHGNKVIKPSLALKTTNSGTEENQAPLYGRNEQVEWQNSNSNGYQTQQLIQVQEDDSQHFKDSNMDMDKANEENEQLNNMKNYSGAIQRDMDSQDPEQVQGDSELQQVADSPYGNNTAAGNGVNADWQIIN